MLWERSGAADGTRTHALILTKDVPYQLGHGSGSGGDSGARTRDTTLFRGLLYLLSYIAMKWYAR